MITPYLEEKILKGEAIYRRATIGFSPLMAILCQPLKTLIITEVEILPMTASVDGLNAQIPNWIEQFNEETVFQVNIYNGKTNNFIFYKPDANYSPNTNNFGFVKNPLGFSLPARKYDTYIVSNNDVIINVCMIDKTQNPIVQYGPLNTIVKYNFPDAQNPLGRSPINTNTLPVIENVDCQSLMYFPVTQKYINTSINSPNGTDEFIIGYPFLDNNKLNGIGIANTLSFEIMNQLAQFNIEFVILNQNKA
jgi:hypothetical protein